MKNFSVLFLILFLFGCNETLHEDPGILLNENSFVSERMETCRCQAQFQNGNNFDVIYAGHRGVNTPVPQTNGFDIFTWGIQVLNAYETSPVFEFNAENPLANGKLNEFLLDITTFSEASCLSFRIALSCDGSPLKFKSIIIPNSVDSQQEIVKFAEFVSEGSCETKTFSNGRCYQLPSDLGPSDNPNCDACQDLALD